MVTLPPVLVKTSWPLKDPVAVGCKVTVTVFVALAANVEPFAGRPVAAKGDAGVVLVPKVSETPPPFWRVTVFEVVLLSATCPKLKLVGVAVRRGGCAPVPERATLTLPPLLLTTTLPAAAPTAEGEKVTLTVVEAPGARTPNGLKAARSSCLPLLCLNHPQMDGLDVLDGSRAAKIKEVLA